MTKTKLINIFVVKIGCCILPTRTFTNIPSNSLSEYQTFVCANFLSTFTALRSAVSRADVCKPGFLPARAGWSGIIMVKLRVMSFGGEVLPPLP